MTPWWELVGLSPMSPEDMWWQIEFEFVCPPKEEESQP